MPLSAGARSCLGQNFALLESKIVLIQMVGQFRMKLKEGYKSFLKNHAFSEPVSSIIIDVADIWSIFMISYIILDLNYIKKSRLTQ